MNTLAKLREFVAVRSILHDAIEERFGQRHDHDWLSLPATDRIGVLSLEFNTLVAELVGEIQWRPWSNRFAKSLDVYVYVVGSDARLRRRRIRQRLERHYIQAAGGNADVRSTSMMRVMFDQMATAQIELEERLETQMFQALASTHLVPYTDDGITLIQNSIHDVLEAQGLTNVNVSAVHTGDQQVDVVYAANLPNAIDTVTISGTVEL